MPIIILIPALVCTVALFLQTPAKVFRSIVLPVLLFFPLLYSWKVTLLPPLDFAESALLPLGFAMAIRSMRHWRVSLIDLWLLLFVFTTFWTDHTKGQQTTSTFELFGALCEAIIPYMAGKLLIEADGARAETVRRLVTLLCVSSLIAMFERFAGKNAFKLIFSPFFPGDQFSWNSQFRGGYARITGAFWQAELAGTIFVIGILLTLWLGKYTNWGGTFRNAPWLPLRKSTAIAGTLIVALFLTQSRGPELGFLFGLPVALVGRSRRIVRAGVLVAAFMLVGGATAYFGIMKYSATAAPTSEQQQTAAYRAIMIDKYVPMAEHSGPWGLGPNFPRIGYQQSIDNEYLWLALTQGWVGLASFLLLSLGTLYHLIMAIALYREKYDQAFATTLLGCFLAMLLILATVYLGFQPYIFFFLLAGWAQALRKPTERKSTPTFQQIYT